MYFAILAKKYWPDWEINVYERNGPDDTFGFGVVFSDETLGFLKDYDEPSYEAIRRSFAYWDDVNINFKGRVLKCAGNGFCGCSRITLLHLLQARCRELGIAMHFNHHITDLDAFRDSDLIIAADGINSFIREKFRDDFGTELEFRSNYFCWLGSTMEMDAFNYYFRKTEHGVICAHAYQYEPGMSTWIFETSNNCWEGHGFGRMTQEQYINELADIFSAELQGHPLINNNSIWRNFPAVRNRTWVRDNIVLIGDAQSSAHWSIGSGTKLAIESSIALCLALKKENANIPKALEIFDTERRAEVEIIQHAANVSLSWFEAMEDHWHLDPEQFAFQLMSRSKQITYDNLILRDSSFVDICDEWFISKTRDAGFQVKDGTPAMFTPFSLRGMTLANRIVMSPMAQYSAVDGIPVEWHYVHYCSRSLGGAGLIYTEMTCPSAHARITPGCTGIWNRQQTAAWKRIVDFAHEHSQAKLCMQIGHAGRKGSTRVAWEGMDMPLAQDNWTIYSASAVKYKEASAVPVEMDREKMDTVKNEFVQAAMNAEAAGFDMIELHMAHGYLLASFISPLTNLRSDEYGGSVDKRMRYPLEIAAAVRKVWPDDKPLSVRISATDWHTGGLDDADLLSVCGMLKQSGVDLINVSTGQTVSDEKPVYGRMFQVPFADRVRMKIDMPVMVAGNIYTADQVNTIILSGRSDLVALARPHLTDPNFSLHAAADYGYPDQIWPDPYLSARNQIYLLAEREREENRRIRKALKPPTHKVSN